MEVWELKLYFYPTAGGLKKKKKKNYNTGMMMMMIFSYFEVLLIARFPEI